MITAVVVSFLGIIGFIGLVSPHGTVSYRERPAFPLSCFLYCRGNCPPRGGYRRTDYYCSCSVTRRRIDRVPWGTTLPLASHPGVSFVNLKIHDISFSYNSHPVVHGVSCEPALAVKLSNSGPEWGR